MRQTERARRARAVAVAHSASDRGSAYAALLVLAGLSLIVVGHALPTAIALLRPVWPG